MSHSSELTIDHLSSKTFNLKELFENNYFTIPDYQRGYSWEKEHLEDLIKDIENVSKFENKHYTGTIVASRTTPKDSCYDLVDGQQRLTTLVILLNEIFHFDKTNYEEIKELYLVRGKSGDEKNVFTPNLETRDCFDQAVLGQKDYQPTIKSHEAILDARDFFRGYLLKNTDNINFIYNTVTQKLSFLFFTPLHDKEIGIMFEVINNRGKKLSELEKIKNFFIYYATVHDKNKLRSDINSQWVNIQINLSQANRTSNDDENAFLRYCYLVFFKTTKEKSWNVYDECKLEFNVKSTNTEYVDSVVDRMRGFVYFLSNASLHYGWFFNQGYFINSYKNDCKDDLNKCLTYLRCQPTYASIMPLYLSIMTRLNNIEQTLKLLKLLEVLNMRLYVLPEIFSRADSKQANLFNFAYEFFNDPDWHSSEEEPYYTDFNNIIIIGDIFDWLYHNMAQITYEFCYSEKMYESLNLDESEQYNFYRWQGIRYFLACYEEEIRSKKAKRSFDIQRILSGKKAVGENLNDQLSLEHIWASKNMVDDFPEEYYTKRRLGNFVLCGLSSNIALSKNSIPDKIDILMQYNGAGDGALDMLQVAELAKIKNAVIEGLGNKRQTKNYWRDLANNLCTIREDALQKFAAKRWALPNEKPYKKM